MKTQNWHLGFLQSLEEIAGIERQRRAWVDGDEGAFPSPAELICQLFDDSGVDDLLEDGRVFSEATDDMLRKLSSLAGKIDLKVQPDVLLSSDEWIELAHQAACVLDMAKADLAL